MGPTEPMHVSRIRGNTPIEVPDWGGEKKGRNGRKEKKVKRRIRREEKEERGEEGRFRIRQWITWAVRHKCTSWSATCINMHRWQPERYCLNIDHPEQKYAPELRYSIVEWIPG